MPVVRRAERQIDLAPLPSGQKRAAATPQSEGAGLAQAQGQQAAAVGDLGGVMARIGIDRYTKAQDQARQEAHQAAMLEASNQLSDWHADFFYNKDTGAYLKTGKDAQSIPDEAKASFDKRAGEIEAGLSTPEQREDFARLRAQTWHTSQLEVLRHTTTEARAYHAEAHESFLENQANEAEQSALDPKLVDVHVMAGLSAIRTNARALGMGDDAVAARSMAFTTKVHSGVIHTLLSQGKDREASHWFSVHQSEIAAEQQSSLANQLETASTHGTALKASEELWTAHGPKSDTDPINLDTMETDARARFADDPKTLAATIGYLRERKSGVDASRRDRDEARGSALWQAVTNGQSLSAIHRMPEFLTSSGKVQAQINAAVIQQAGGGRVETDWNTYYSLFTLGSNERTRDDFAKTNLMDYRGRLGDSEFKHLMEMQSSIRSNDGKRTTGLVASQQEQNDIVNDALVSIGLDPTPSAPGSKTYNKFTSDRVVAFRRSVRDAVASREALNGNKKLGAEEIQSIVDTLMVPVGTREIGKTFFGNAVTVPSFGFEQPQAQAARAADVPAGERRRIEEALRRDGQPVTDVNVLRLFNQKLRQVRGD